MSPDEKHIVSAWKTLLRQRGIKYDDDRLRALLQWCRREGSEATLHSAFSISAWEDIGKKLWNAISDGTEGLEGLAPTWKLVLTTLKTWYDELQKEQGALGEESLARSMADLTLTDSAPNTSPPPSSSSSFSSSPAKNISPVEPPPARTYTSAAVPPPSRDYPSPAAQLTIRAKEKKHITPPSSVESAGSVPTAVGSIPITAGSIPTAALPAAAKAHNSGSSSLEDSDDSDGERSLHEVELLFQKGSHSKKPSRTPKSKPICLPPAKVVVLPRDPASFWEGLHREAARTGDWDLCKKIGYPSFRDQGECSTLAEGLQAFPVMKAAVGSGKVDEHHVFAWKVVQDLQFNVGKYGLNSPQVMRLIRVINADLLAPYDITHLAQILLEPVQAQLFERKWAQMAARAERENLTRADGDPLKAVGAQALMGQEPFSSPDLQATWHPSVLQEAQKLGMAALLQVMEMSAPRQRYTAIKQEHGEPFLKFIERLAQSLEKQVEDDTLRQKLCLQLARDQANTDCRKIIDSLPGSPDITDMVEACSKIGSIDHSMSAMAAILRSPQICHLCHQETHIKPCCPQRKVKNIRTCARCGRQGHFAKQCRSQYHAAGHPLSGNGKRSAMRRAEIQVPPAQVLPQRPAGFPCVTDSQAKPPGLPAWMFPQLPPSQS
ncbi:hypothetical protein BTVI_47918 [Pitangus sulphuratus]|nr:hypothetical protein BTVI_47918 [Pitangus sulphuratus]